MISTAYLLLGSNKGNKLRLLQEATALIDRLAGKIIQCSSFYESEPWGFECDEWFINQAVLIRTSLSSERLLQTTQEIERMLGRSGWQATGDRRQYAARTMDIDILFYDEMVMRTPTLTIPHPLLQERLFTLLPLAEIAAEFIHPLFKKSIAVLLEECCDRGTV
ncbi:MAG: 2-amino-4-hydroxy-6-hydroxymethyldihydropteridine diphosphokinase, partial [Bacteroidales bacterium]|nr:2-amino-4-hydroxy-6-hydroxymethyldihydropteridine diphosphokinase [Bacteroidales bacterium]